MSWTAIVLVVISAGMHAGWNLLGKKEHPTTAFFLVAAIFGFLIFVPVPVYYWDRLALIPVKVWCLVIATGIAMTIYYVSLAGAYRSGNMSIAYPLARSSPVIVVTAVAVLLGRGDQISRQCVIGILLVVGGCFILPMKKFSDFRLRNYWNLTCLLAFFAACGTAGYSIIDDEAMREMRNTAELTLNKPEVAILYASLESMAAITWMWLVVLMSKSERTALSNVFRNRKLRALIIGLSINLTYSLVLISMAFAVNVSYIVGFRQLSIPLGVLLGVAILKEPGYLPKFIGTGVIFTGLILVGTG